MANQKKDMMKRLYDERKKKGLVPVRIWCKPETKQRLLNLLAQLEESEDR